VVGIVTVAQFAMTYLPALQQVFATESVPLKGGLLITAIGISLFALIETEKQIRLPLRSVAPLRADSKNRERIGGLHSSQPRIPASANSEPVPHAGHATSAVC
jgi:hypothetical protein